MSLGFIFPGQGSQEVGMLAELSLQHPVIEACFNRSGELLDLPLWKLVCQGPAEELNRTAITQPVLVTASAALLEIWREQGGAMPDMVAGHSLGEYSALVTAGVLSFADAVRLVNVRGRLMQEVVPEGEGTMAAVLGLEDDQVELCCAEAAAETRGVVSAANYNSPGQVVIAGATESVLKAIEICQARGARRAVQLAVSAPFHCELMRPAAERFRSYVDKTEFHEPQIPVVQNTDACISRNVPEIQQKLIDQIAQPVRWTDCVKTMIKTGMTDYVECGPGKVLSGLMRRIDRSVSGGGIDTAASLAKALEG